MFSRVGFFGLFYRYKESGRLSVRSLHTQMETATVCLVESKRLLMLNCINVHYPLTL